MADRDPALRLRRPALAGRPAPTGEGDGESGFQGRVRGRPRTEPGLDAGRQPLWRHDHRRTLSPPRSGRGRAILVPAPRTDRAGSRHPQRRHGRRARRVAARIRGTLPRRHVGRRRERPDRDRRTPGLRTPPRLLDLRLVPARRGHDRPAPYRQRRALGGLLSARPVPLLVAGAACIAFSEILVRLADVPPSTAAFYRCAYAVPPLLAMALWERRRYGSRGIRSRTLAWVAGGSSAGDLILWHHSI